MMRATSFLRAGAWTGVPFDIVVLDHDERHLRRKLLILQHGDEVLVDFAEPVRLHQGDVLVLEDGRMAEIIAGEEELSEVRARSEHHLMELCWHLGNRHLPCQIVNEEADKCLLILKDHVIKAMLEGLGAEVVDVLAPFEPLRGAYHAHPATSAHSHEHDHGQSHAHGDHHHHD